MHCRGCIPPLSLTQTTSEPTESARQPTQALSLHAIAPQALPFAAGYKTEAVGRLLAATLAAEALTCWRFWADWPTRSYAAHVR